ncbi:MAG TPA: peptidoglycan-binding protein [Symbiobacteriaceae bacterium]
MVQTASRYLRYIPENPMQGPDVLWVQERLRALGYYAGPLNSTYDRGTHDAVVAFQAQRELVPDGIVGPVTYSALGTGATPAGIGSRGPAITVDVDERRLYLRVRGRVQRTYPVAVGAPNTPTPLGHWVIVQKTVDPGGPFGTRWMRLNVPWGGYGIHGTNDDSSIGRAVSHGCIRLHNWDVEDLYSRVPVGTSVIIVGQVLTGRMLFPGRASGSDVRVIQEYLQVLGFYDGVVDGVYDEETAAAVRRFQRSRGLTPDGIVGPDTYDALMKQMDISQQSTDP